MKLFKAAVILPYQCGIIYIKKEKMTLFIKCKSEGEPRFTCDVSFSQEQAVNLLKEYREDDKNSKYVLSETEGIDGLIRTQFNRQRYDQYKKI